MLICQLNCPNSHKDSRSHVGCLQQIPNLGNVTIRVSVLKTTTSSLNPLLPRDLVSYVERGAVSGLNSWAQLSPCCTVSSLMLTAIGWSFHNQVSVSVQHHHEVPSNLNDERQSEAPPSGNKQRRALWCFPWSQTGSCIASWDLFAKHTYNIMGLGRGDVGDC